MGLVQLVGALRDEDNIPELEPAADPTLLPMAVSTVLLLPSELIVVVVQFELQPVAAALVAVLVSVEAVVWGVAVLVAAFAVLPVFRFTVPGVLIFAWQPIMVALAKTRLAKSVFKLNIGYLPLVNISSYLQPSYRLLGAKL